MCRPGARVRVRVREGGWSAKLYLVEVCTRGCTRVAVGFVGVSTTWLKDLRCRGAAPNKASRELSEKAERASGCG